MKAPPPSGMERRGAPLSGKDRRALRARGHHLDPVVQVGRAGITAALVEAVGQALEDHELIKVKVLEAAPEGRRETAAELARETGSELVQVLGRTALLWRERPAKPPEKPAPAPARKAPARKAPAARKEPREGTGARLPPRRHGR